MGTFLKKYLGHQGAGRDTSDEWYTPPQLVGLLGHFDLDPAAGPMRHAKTNFRKRDGLKHNWRGRVWLNPPYSNIELWARKMAAHGNGICLVSARPDMRWFHELLNRSSAVLWLFGHQSFLRPDGSKGHLPYASVLIAFGESNHSALRDSGLGGTLMRKASAVSG
jgi:hypothetical protein